jgi:lipid-binding SYLF domain-containing protein
VAWILLDSPHHHFGEENEMDMFRKTTAVLLMSFAAATAFAQQHKARDGDAISEGERDQRREEILTMSKSTIATFAKDEVAGDLFDQAYGYAVFDTTKGGFIVTGAGGTGVAARKSGSHPVFMHLGAGGVGLGAGLENYKLVMLFESKETYDDFVEGEWSAGVSAQAAAGEDGKAAVGRFVNGVAVYHITDKGLIAQVDVTGVKFWPSDRLNEGPA